MDKKADKCILVKYKFALPMILLSGIIFMILAWKMDANAGPDEVFRYKVAEWIAANNRLPSGYEDELVNPTWCYSYAFTPYLPSILAAFFIKIISLFTAEPRVLLFAARLVNVFAGMGTIYVALRAGDKLFANKGSVCFFAAVTAYLPQFTFLAGYLNNDVITALAAFMILDALLEADRYGWNFKNMLYLAAGTGICMLTYYFGYGWVLASVAGFFYISLHHTKDRRETFKKAGIVALMVFVIAGWYFIRNGIMYHGDFLGYHAQNDYVGIYAAEHGIIPANNPGMKSMFLRDMLHNGRWMETTTESFIGMFGGMIICLDGKFYDFYITAFWLCIFLFVLYRYKTKEKIKTAFIMLLLFEIAFPIIFSIYSSYVRDYSPQGRYLIAVLPAVAVFTSVGIDEFSKALSERFKWGRHFPMIATAMLLLVFAVILYTVILPTVCFIYLPGADKVFFYYVR